jgi:sugar (pentulose or hexulose) kinase
LEEFKLFIAAAAGDVSAGLLAVPVRGTTELEVAVSWATAGFTTVNKTPSIAPAISNFSSFVIGKSVWFNCNSTIVGISGFIQQTRNASDQRFFMQQMR